MRRINFPQWGFMEYNEKQGKKYVNQQKLHKKVIQGVFFIYYYFLAATGSFLLT